MQSSIDVKIYKADTLYHSTRLEPHPVSPTQFDVKLKYTEPKLSSNHLLQIKNTIGFPFIASCDLIDPDTATIERILGPDRILFEHTVALSHRDTRRRMYILRLTE